MPGKRWTAALPALILSRTGTATTANKAGAWTAPRDSINSGPPIVARNKGPGGWIDFWVILRQHQPLSVLLRRQRLGRLLPTPEW
jgi:hypothetical protein